jgi:hypothetical protein
MKSRLVLDSSGRERGGGVAADRQRSGCQNKGQPREDSTLGEFSRNTSARSVVNFSTEL